MQPVQRVDDPLRGERVLVPLRDVPGLLTPEAICEAIGMAHEFGRRAVENVATVYDFYATVLHLLALDYT